MHKIDAIHTAHPTFGYRKITDILCKYALINHKRVHRLMKAMDIITIYPKPNLSKRYHAQYVKPYLFIYWYSMCIVDYELSSTLEKGFVMTCLKRAFYSAELVVPRRFQVPSLNDNK
jgi:putative transposase